MSINPYRQAEYLLSAHQISHLPADTGAEVAFVGRSNVGKSSVINTITDQKGLARTSKTPGRTQQINFFSVEDGIRLVDLPGYGFAKVALSIKKQWTVLINEYLVSRESLAGLIMIIDIRREVSAEDRQMLEWCRSTDIPVHVLLNKSDKLAYGKRKQAQLRFQTELAGLVVSAQLYSATAKTGIDEARAVLNSWLFSKKLGPGVI